jgi:hypothetical protein
MTEHRFHFIAKVTKLRGSHAVRLTYHTGETETVSTDYLVRTAERIGHREAQTFREHLAPRFPGAAWTHPRGWLGDLGGSIGSGADGFDLQGMA